MKLVALIPVLVAATAHAQAPGEFVPMANPPGTPMAGPPGTVMVVAPAGIPVMENRWAIGLSVGSLSIAPKDQPDDKTKFGIGELSLRYRATVHLELELALSGGREQLSDGTQGDRDVNVGMVGARYRFCAFSEWNWWLGGSIGSLSVTPTGASDQDKRDAQRPMGALSIGIEHRWRQFAIQAELRGFGVGEPKNSDAKAAPAPVAVMTPAGTNQPVPPPQPAVMTAPSQQQSGGMLTIGASYYF
jgi:hypothetical protein